jgi:hypothetical protein
MKIRQLKTSIRRWVVFFMIALALSGATAFPLETELDWLAGVWPRGNAVYNWLARVDGALKDTNAHYPFMAYGYDWLAFAHLMIAMVFIGVLRNPVRNKWVIEFGMLACVAVFPLAFIAGAIRGIPVFWRLIDCSFGVIGLIPLRICYRKIVALERLTAQRT